jgi:hypothetical protein
MLGKNREAPVKALTISLVASAALCFASATASAVPAANLTTVASDLGLHRSVVWVCGPFRCWWRPWGYYRPWAYYRPWYPAYGYYRLYGFYGYGPQGGVYGAARAAMDTAMDRRGAGMVVTARAAMDTAMGRRGVGMAARET